MTNNEFEMEAESEIKRDLQEIWLERIGITVRFVTISFFIILLVISFERSFAVPLVALTLGDLVFTLIRIALVMLLFLWLFRWRQDRELSNTSNMLWGIIGSAIIGLAFIVGSIYSLWIYKAARDFDPKQYIIEERAKGISDDAIYDELQRRGVIAP